AEDGIRDYKVTGVQTCALPIWAVPALLPPEGTQGRRHREPSPAGAAGSTTPSVGGRRRGRRPGRGRIRGPPGRIGGGRGVRELEHGRAKPQRGRPAEVRAGGPAGDERRGRGLLRPRGGARRSGNLDPVRPGGDQGPPTGGP